MPSFDIHNLFSSLHGVAPPEDRSSQSSRTPHEGASRPGGQGFARIASRFEEFFLKRGENILASLLEAHSPARDTERALNAIFRGAGWDIGQSAPVPGHDAASSAPQDQARPADYFGDRLRERFRGLFDDVMPPNLAAFLEQRPQQISRELEQFRTQLLHHREHGGPPPAPPRSLPSHLHAAVAQLDPRNAQQYAEDLLEMVQADGELQQRANQATMQGVGQVPRPRPGHEHGQSGGPWEPDLAPDGQPQPQEPENDAGAPVYPQPPVAPPASSPTVTYRPPTVQSDSEGDRPPPRPPKI